MPHNEKVENIPSETFYCYKPDELKNVEDEPYGGGTDTYHYLTCPNCGKKMRWC